MSRVNSKGYELISAGKLEQALEVYKFNSMVFPDYWNVWDSSAEWYFKMKNYDFAKNTARNQLRLILMMRMRKKC